MKRKHYVDFMACPFCRTFGEQGVISKGYMAPGHNSVLTDDGRYYMVHHTRTFSLPEYWFTMNVREMYFNE
ncbi:MAG: hypothetical protein GX028_08155, partial [Clostridiaceae bacterium]|nr:hypothetical protein [Clostridiaceae bacterium]